MTEAFINRIATAVPPYDVHETFRTFAQSLFDGDRRGGSLFRRMAVLSGIEHRYSVLAPLLPIRMLSPLFPVPVTFVVLVLVSVRFSTFAVSV